MTSRKQYLALIPAYFNDEHEETAEYYINNIPPLVMNLKYRQVGEPVAYMYFNAVIVEIN